MIQHPGPSLLEKFERNFKTTASVQKTYNTMTQGCPCIYSHNYIFTSHKGIQFHSKVCLLAVATKSCVQCSAVASLCIISLECYGTLAFLLINPYGTLPFLASCQSCSCFRGLWICGYSILALSFPTRNRIPFFVSGLRSVSSPLDTLPLPSCCSQC